MAKLQLNWPHERQVGEAHRDPAERLIIQGHTLPPPLLMLGSTNQWGYLWSKLLLHVMSGPVEGKSRAPS